MTFTLNPRNQKVNKMSYIATFVSTIDKDTLRYDVESFHTRTLTYKEGEHTDESLKELAFEYSQEDEHTNWVLWDVSDVDVVTSNDLLDVEFEEGDNIWD